MILLSSPNASISRPAALSCGTQHEQPNNFIQNNEKYSTIAFSVACQFALADGALKRKASEVKVIYSPLAFYH